jgi:hypothetical protein
MLPWRPTKQLHWATITSLPLRCAVKWVIHLQRSTDAAAEVGAIRAGEYVMDGQVFWWAVYGLGCLNRLGVRL